MPLGSKPIKASEVIDFPEPDSPTTAIISFGRISKDIDLIIEFAFFPLKNEIDRLFTFSKVSFDICKNNIKSMTEYV
tara:strand:- start:6318 stop:6548 length:231 start_codon:yes stop_codon:yes gene_type:complete